MSESNQNQTGQLNLFDYDPSIKNLGILDVHISSGQIRGSFVAATETNDIALLTPERWAEAFSEYLLKCCHFQIDSAISTLSRVYNELLAENEAVSFEDIAANNPQITPFKQSKRKAK